MRARVATILIILGLLMGLTATPVAAAGLTVNSTADTAPGDDGFCTLREAITAANDDAPSGAAPGECIAGSGADVITFSVAGTITVGSALPAISSDLTILGAGAVTVNGGGAFQVFNVGSVTVTLSGLTMTNGSTGGPGGGIANDGTLTVTDSTVSGNFAGGPGGGILNNGTLTVTDSTVSGNTAGNAGGGINNHGTLTVSNATILGNTATFGAGILNDHGTLDIIGSAVSQNTATSGGGGGMTNVGGTIAVTNSVIADNVASGGSGGIANSFGGNVTVTNSTISGNSTSNWDGGGINNEVGGTLTVVGSTIDGNSSSATGGGIANYPGGILTVVNTTLQGNSATSGGGIANHILGSLTLTNSTFSGNSASTTGGGIDNGGTATVRNSLFVGELPTAITNEPGGTLTSTNNVFAAGPAGVLDPAGLANNGGPTQTIALALVAGNPAIDTGTSATCAAAPVSGLDQRGMPRPAACDIGAYEAQPPTVAAHANVTVPANSASGAVVTYTPPAGTDEQGGAATVACLPASGSAFPVGTTIVTCTATDAVGHTATGTFSVIVGAFAPAPAPSLPDAAMARPGPESSSITIGFAVLLIGSLGALAVANLGVVRRR